MFERLTKSLEVPALNEFNDAERTITHFISTESVDRDGDIVRSDGGNFASYRANPIVLWRHDDREPPIGKNLWLKIDTRNGVKGILAKTQFADTEDAIEIYNLWKGGFLSAASIRFSPTKSINLTDSSWGPKEFVEWELLEYSIVPIPANAEALRLALKSVKPGVALAVEKSLSDMERKTTEDMIKALSDRLETTLGRIESMLNAAKSQAEEPATPKETETPAAAPAETLAEVKAYDMQSVVARILGGEVS